MGQQDEVMTWLSDQGQSLLDFQIKFGGCIVAWGKVNK